MKQALLLLPVLTFTPADTWQPFTLGKQLVVQLPVSPTEMKEDMGLPAGTHAYVAQSGNDFYQILGPIPVESTVNVQDEKARQQYYEDMIEGLVKDQGNVLLSRKTFHTAAGKGMAVTYQAPATATSKALVLFSRLVIAKRNAYSLTFFRTTDDTATTVTQRRRFFDSVTVKP